MRVMRASHACRQHEFVELSKLGSGRAVLLGAAAHAVAPALSVGCNTALADGAALAAAVRAVDGDLASAAAQFTAARLPEVTALRRNMRDPWAIAAYPLHKTLRRQSPVPLPLLLSLLERLLAAVWNLMHRLAPGSTLPCMLTPPQPKACGECLGCGRPAHSRR